MCLFLILKRSVSDPGFCNYLPLVSSVMYKSDSHHYPGSTPNIIILITPYPPGSPHPPPPTTVLYRSLSYDIPEFLSPHLSNYLFIPTIRDYP
jgi:hypothetical protein